jgi:hypothetical protein
MREDRVRLPASEWHFHRDVFFSFPKNLSRPHNLPPKLKITSNVVNGGSHLTMLEISCLQKCPLQFFKRGGRCLSFCEILSKFFTSWSSATSDCTETRDNLPVPIHHWSNDCLRCLEGLDWFESNPGASSLLRGVDYTHQVHNVNDEFTEDIHMVL